MIQSTHLPINFSPAYKSPSLNSVVQYLDQNIRFYEKWQHVAASTQNIAFRLIATALACTALIFSSPLLPVIGLIGIGAFCAVIFRPTDYLSFLAVVLLMPLTFGISEKIKILVYTRSVAAITLIATSIILGSAGAALVILTYIENSIEKRKLYLQDLRTHALRLESDPTYSPPKEESHALLLIYKKVHIDPFVHGVISILPYQLEEHITRLGWERG